MSTITRTIASDWYSGVERQYRVTVEVALDWHTQEIDSFDDVTAVELVHANGWPNPELPLEILDRAFVESLRRAVQEQECPGVLFA